MGLRKYRMAADDINEADPNMVDDLNRLDFMLEKGDDWLLELFTDEREHENGIIKAYLDHDAITEHEAKLAKIKAYEQKMKEIEAKLAQEKIQQEFYERQRTQNLDTADDEAVVVNKGL